MMLQSQYKYNQINCMNGKELHEETDTYESELVSFSPQMQKVRLIDHNTKYFRSLLFFSIQIGCLRLIFFFIIIIFEEHFIISQPPNNYSQSWNIMFFVLAAMMDFLGVLNDVQIFKHLQKDETLLRTIKNNLLTKTQIRMQTQIGSYVYYLSIYDIIKKYKYRSKSSISISQTIRFLHVLITICIFGNLAISWQNSVDDQTFKVIFLWGFLLSIYLSVFELDFFVLQNSSGPFIDKKSGQKDIHMQQMSESVQSSIIKNRYIKNCRRPFEICYIFNILAMLALIIVYFKLSLLTLMLIFSILAHMTELIHQKYLQNKLMDLNIEKLPYVFLSPYKILRQLTKNSRFLFGFITISTRTIIVLAIFAFFKESETTTIQNLCMLATNFLIIFSQTVKFKRLDNTKLYILKRQIALSPQGTECSICLLQMSKSEMQYRLPCFSKHIFHEKCMKNWFDQRKQCPLCRYSLRIYELK